MAKYDLAAGYVREALSYEIHSRFFETSIVTYGIPVALHIKDEKMLNACARESVIASVFESGQPTRIAQLSAAFAQLYGLRGQEQKARTLLREALHYVQNAYLSWNLLLEISRQGNRVDIPQARKILEARAALPSAEVTHAYLSLFDAYNARREKRTAEVHAKANEAAERFDAIRWYALADSARALLPLGTALRRPEEPYRFSVSSRYPQLTERERQVAELVLRGLTNREVSAKLSITENTVEKHMVAIMGRLGIRSRHQIGDVLEPVS